MTNLPELFKSFVSKELLFKPQDKLLLAVSGGLDSVVLCELCHQAGYDFVIAHCNFQLRGPESNRDEEFVRQLAGRYQRPVMVRTFDTQQYADSRKISIQVAARELRYSWFEDLVCSGSSNEFEQKHASPVGISPQWIVTAHHANDNIETLLINLFRGTGISGLRGILPKQGRVVRPLLFAKKEDLVEFASGLHLQWVEDSSNQSDKYSRNVIRQTVLPAAIKIFPQLEDNIIHDIGRFREAEQLYLQAIELHKKKLCHTQGKECHIPVQLLLKSRPLHSIIYEIIKDFGFGSAQVQEVVDLCASVSGKQLHSAGFRILKNRNWLIISPKQDDRTPLQVIERDDKEITFESGHLTISTIASEACKFSSVLSIAHLDNQYVEFPMILRRWKKGDYFYPLGLKKKKKLGRFFIDNKLPLTKKENTWVIESNKKILWVVGMRIDERFKVTPGTKEVLKIELRMP